MVLRVKHFLLFLLVYLNYSGYAQQLNFVNISNSLNLPSQETYSITQDSKGYIWIATEQGFCRYDGKTTKVYDRLNGLPEGGVYSVVEDKKGWLWLLTAKGRVLILENGKLKEAVFSKSIVKKNSQAELAYGLMFSENKLYYIATNKTYEIDTASNQIERMQNPSYYTRLFFHKNEIIPLNSSLSEKKLAYYTFEKIRKKNSGREFLLIDGYKASYFNDHITNTDYHYSIKVLSVRSKEGYYFTNYEKLYFLDKKKKFKQVKIFPQQILCLYIDRNGGLWVGLQNEGLWYFPDGDLEKEPFKMLSNLSVSSVLEDREHTLWCTTLEKGVYNCKNKYIFNYLNLANFDHQADVLRVVDNLLFVSMEPKQLDVWTNNVLFHQYILPQLGLDRLYGVNSVNGSFFLYSTSSFLGVTSDFKGFNKIIFKKDFYNYLGGFSAISDEHYFYVLTKRNIFKADKKFRIRAKIDINETNRILYKINESTALVGGKNGVSVLDLTKFTLRKITDKDLIVTSFLKDLNGTIWITTKTDGLFQLIDGKLVNTKGFIKLPTVILSEIIQNKNGNYFIASNKGIIKLIKVKNKYQVELFNTKHGLLSNETNKLAILNDNLFISSTNGIQSVFVSQLKRNLIAPLLYFDYCQISDSTLQWKNGIQLESNHNTLEFKWINISLKNSTSGKLMYKLYQNKILNDHKRISGNEIAFQNLLPGHYKLVVRGINEDGIFSIKPVILYFTILPPFWQTGWFISLMVLLLILIVYGIVRFSTYRIRKKEKEKNRIQQLLAESQLSALQAQMNPHFIFNAINSIQNYILKKQEREAYDYLAKFSKLIRIVLHNSQQKMLTLDEELETINLYISLEQLRFQEKFEFVLHIDPAIAIYETLIPTMFIQPYLENAIWHGIMPLENRKGILSLSIEVRNNMLHLEIEDNGIGRQTALQKKQGATKNHQPFAMRLTQERINVVGMMLGSDQFKIEIVDKEDADGLPLGTKIVVDLPMIIKDE